MPTFSELLSQYIQRSGITDAELARGIGVRRQTIFRWKEGLVERPRNRDDVMQLAKRLRLSGEERDGLLIAAGFPPEQMPSLPGASTSTPPVTNTSPPLATTPLATATPQVPPQATPTQETTIAASLGAKKSILQAAEPKQGDHILTAQMYVTPAPSIPSAAAAQPVRSGWRAPRRRWALPALGLFVLVLGLGLSRGVGGLRNWLAPATATPAPGSAPVLTLHAPTPPPAATRYRIVADDGETLLLVATFSNYAGNAGFNIAGRIEEALQQQITAAKLANTKVLLLDEEIGNASKAEAQLAAARAAMLLWGEYDNARVVVNFAVRGDLENPHIRRDLLSLDELPTVINRDVPQQVRSLALFTLGQLFRSDGQVEPAKAALENALALDPSNELRAKIYFTLGSLYGQGTEDELNNAIAFYAEAIALRPADANAFYNRGLASWNRYRLYSDSSTDLNDAIQDFTQTITLKPSFATAYLNRGAAYYARSDLAKSGDADARRSDIQHAVADFGRTLQLEPENNDALYNRGLAYIRAGNNTLWQDDLLQAQQFAAPPRARDIYAALCWGHALAQEPQEALPHCEQAVAMNPDRHDIDDSLGMVYAQLGDLEKASAYFNTYLAWLKTQPPSYYDRYDGARVEEWIGALEQGDNPITAAAMEEIR